MNERQPALGTERRNLTELEGMKLQRKYRYWMKGNLNTSGKSILNRKKKSNRALGN